MDNTYIPNEYTACEKYHGHIIAMKDGHYRSFRGFGGLARTRPCASRAECRRMIERYNEQEAQYHAATGAW